MTKTLETALQNEFDNFQFEATAENEVKKWLPKILLYGVSQKTINTQFVSAKLAIKLVYVNRVYQILAEYGYVKIHQTKSSLNKGMHVCDILYQDADLEAMAQFGFMKLKQLRHQVSSTAVSSNPAKPTLKKSVARSAISATPHLSAISDKASSAMNANQSVAKPVADKRLYDLFKNIGQALNQSDSESDDNSLNDWLSQFNQEDKMRPFLKSLSAMLADSASENMQECDSMESVRTQASSVASASSKVVANSTKASVAQAHLIDVADSISQRENQIVASQQVQSLAIKASNSTSNKHLTSDKHDDSKSIDASSSQSHFAINQVAANMLDNSQESFEKSMDATMTKSSIPHAEFADAPSFDSLSSLMSQAIADEDKLASSDQLDKKTLPYQVPDDFETVYQSLDDDVLQKYLQCVEYIQSVNQSLAATDLEDDNSLASYPQNLTADALNEQIPDDNDSALNQLTTEELNSSLMALDHLNNALTQADALENVPVPVGDTFVATVDDKSSAMASINDSMELLRYLDEHYIIKRHVHFDDTVSFQNLNQFMIDESDIEFDLINRHQPQMQMNHLTYLQLLQTAQMLFDAHHND